MSNPLIDTELHDSGRASIAKDNIFSGDSIPKFRGMDELPQKPESEVYETLQDGLMEEMQESEKDTGNSSSTESHPFEKVYDDLPPLLRKACEVFKDSKEKRVFLFGSLGVLSGCLPNVEATYRGSIIKPNLYCYLLSPYGNGKGTMSFARKLAFPIHHKLREEAEALRKQYEADLEVYAREMADYKKGVESIAPEKPEPPKKPFLFLPSNNTEAGMRHLLSLNNRKGIIFETEADTLSEALGRKCGGFISLLLKAFHHEPDDSYRKGDDEFLESEGNELSVVLSSTYSQLPSLMPTIENGLVSRCCFMDLELDTRVLNPQEEGIDNYGAEIRHIAEHHILGLWERVNALPNPVRFKMTKEQANILTQQFQEHKDELIESYGEDMNGMVNRMMFIAYRIGMVLSAIRHFHECLNPPKNGLLVLKDQDFQTVLTLSNFFLNSSTKVCSFLKRQGGNSIIDTLSQDKRDFFNALPTGDVFTTKEAVQVGGEMGIHRKTVERILPKWVKTNVLQKPRHGFYLKPKH